jgi:3'-5' exonuclease
MSVQSYLVFDIETCPLPWKSYSESQQEYLLRGASTEEEISKKKSECGLTPLTAQVICIGLQLMKYDESVGYRLVHSKAFATDNSLDDNTGVDLKLPSNIDCILYSERKVLKLFWDILAKYDPVHLISFNGRNFDAPFLMLRSALLGIKPSKNLMQGTKFNYSLHTDLIDELTFYIPGQYGATRRFNFDFYTRAFGIKSPKSEGIDGSKVAEFYAEGKIADIAEYCMRDVSATWQLFEIWNKFLNFK